MQIDLSNEQACEARRAIEAEISRANEALCLPFVQGLSELHGHATNKVRLLSEVLAILAFSGASDATCCETISVRTASKF